MEVSDGGAEVLVQLISPEEVPVCECLHHEEREKLTQSTSKKRSAAEGQQGVLLFLRSWHPPYFIIFVSILEVGIFAWGGAETQRALVYDPHHREQLWRFLTYMLLHSDSLHLALNIAIQCLLAAPLEHEQGHLRTSLVYFGGVLGGSLGTSMLEPELYVMGASGGVYALLISQLANILLVSQAGTVRQFGPFAAELLQRRRRRAPARTHVGVVVDTSGSGAEVLWLLPLSLYSTVAPYSVIYDREMNKYAVTDFSCWRHYLSRKK